MVTWKDRLMIGYMADRVRKLNGLFEEIEENYSINHREFNLNKILYSATMDRSYKTGIEIKIISSKIKSFYPYHDFVKLISIDDIVVYSFENCEHYRKGFIHNAPKEVKLETIEFIKELYSRYKSIKRTMKKVQNDEQVKFMREQQKLNQRYGK